MIAALLPGIPVLLGLIGLLLPPGDGGRDRRRAAGALGIAGAAIALALTVYLLVIAPVEASTSWVDLGGIEVTFGFSAGTVALYVALAVTVVALAVQVYSIAYLHDDHRYAPYAAQISLFTGAMLLVVTSGDLILLLVGWEVMGICSYLLIGHDRRLPEAPRAAVKAFLVTRVGDVGFLLGIAVLGVSAGTFRISEVLTHEYHPGTLTAALVLILAGVAGKSAQFPLHTWLPDAMAGPTPISALIHAATMVAAGVYVVFRLYPLFTQSPAALAVLGVMGAVTLLLGALSATAQDDIKRVLAWSTVSQIGYMIGALAVGSPAAALFHLLTHAAFKALLFLAAGAVIHAVGTNAMSRMGGAARAPAPHVLAGRGRARRTGRAAAAVRVLVQGERPGGGRARDRRHGAGPGLGGLDRLDRRADRRRRHGLVRDPAAAAHVLRSAPGGRRRLEDRLRRRPVRPGFGHAARSAGTDELAGPAAGDPGRTAGAGRLRADVPAGAGAGGPAPDRGRAAPAGPAGARRGQLGGGCGRPIRARTRPTRWAGCGRCSRTVSTWTRSRTRSWSGRSANWPPC